MTSRSTCDGPQNPVVDDLRCYRIGLPLRESYDTSLGSLDRLDSVVCLVEAGGRWVAGEACAVPGYNQETPSEVWATVRSVGAEVTGKPALDGLQILEGRCADQPLARAAISTALEQILWPAPAAVETEHLLLVATVHKRQPDEMAAEVRSYLSAGYRTLKVKVGFDVLDDIRRVTAIVDIVAGAAKLRLDANRQYSYADATRLVGEVDPGGVELLEQPFAVDAWELTSRLSAVSDVPLMLDESVTCRDDIRRVNDAGAALVKFKLMKSGSCRDLSEDIAIARSFGLDVVVGNGVASDIGCFPEIVTCINSGVTRPIESNGFLKPKLSLMPTALTVSEGRVSVVRAQPVVSLELIEALAGANGTTR